MTLRVHFTNGEIRDIDDVFQVKNGDIYYEEDDTAQVIRDEEYTNAYRIDNVPKIEKAVKL